VGRAGSDGADTVALMGTASSGEHDEPRVPDGARPAATDPGTAGAPDAPSEHGPDRFERSGPAGRGGGSAAGAPHADAAHLEHVRWSTRPQLHKPVLVMAFEGWNDAGDSATAAVRHLAKHWSATAFATIDPEIFYDFTTTRPHVHLDDEGQREIVWPENLLACASVSPDLDIITLVGTEPQLRWRTFCAQITGLAELLDVRLVVTVGALLSEVPHTRATPVYGAAYDDELTHEMGLMPSTYEGPTGIVGVLHQACTEAGLPSASLWAAVPTYVPSAPSPKAALALVERASRMLSAAIDIGELVTESERYEEQITELVEADDESRDYVRQLEETYDENEGMLDSSDDLVAEVERFLRDQGD
jgi:proteasome assembly chaperone (PAC2) family protein